VKLDQLASPETWPLNTLFPYPSHTDGQTQKAQGQMTAEATVKTFKRAPSVEMSTWYKGIQVTGKLADQVIKSTSQLALFGPEENARRFVVPFFICLLNRIGPALPCSNPYALFDYSDLC
jgi:hypothetical protein